MYQDVNDLSKTSVLQVLALIVSDKVLFAHQLAPLFR